MMARTRHPKTRGKLRYRIAGGLLLLINWVVICLARHVKLGASHYR